MKNRLPIEVTTIIDLESQEDLRAKTAAANATSMGTAVPTSTSAIVGIKENSIKLSEPKSANQMNINELIGLLFNTKKARNPRSSNSMFTARNTMPGDTTSIQPAHIKSKFPNAPKAHAKEPKH